MHFGSIKKCYLCVLDNNVRVLLLGENHAIKDDNSLLARLFLSEPMYSRNIQYYMEQTSEPLCRKFSTLDKLACSSLCKPGSRCRVDFRAQMVRRLVSPSGTKSQTLLAMLHEYDTRKPVFIRKFTALIRSLEPAATYDAELLEYAVRRVWALVRRVVSLDLEELKRGRLVNVHTGREIFRSDVRRTINTLSFVPVQDTIVYYRILESVRCHDQTPIVYVAGETHVSWLFKLLAPIMRSHEMLDPSEEACRRIETFLT